MDLCVLERHIFEELDWINEEIEKYEYFVRGTEFFHSVKNYNSKIASINSDYTNQLQKKVDELSKIKEGLIIMQDNIRILRTKIPE